MRCWLYVVVAVVALGAFSRPGSAQPIQLKGAEERSLENALLDLRAQAGVDVVFAQRLVEGHHTSCRYQGASPKKALECLLRGTDLRAERVQPEQYVLVRASDAVSRPRRRKASAQRGLLTGLVTDRRTGRVLPGAHVYLPGLQTGTITDEAGYFSFSALPFGEYRVQLSYLGYQTADTMLAAGTRPATIALKPVAIKGERVTVEARRSDVGNYRVVPGLVDMPARELEKLPSFLGGQDLFQAFQWLPGVRRVGAINGGLTIRGGTPDQNLYLLDGAPIYHPWHAFSLISTFQTETLKDTKLYRSSFPAEYGSRLSSVLDAEMRDGSRRSSPRAVAALGMLSGRFLIESPVTDELSFMVAGRRSYLDKLLGREHPVQGEDGQRDTLRTGYYFYDMNAKATYQPTSRHRLSLSYYHGRDDLDLRLPFDVSLDFSSWLEPAPFFFEIGHNWENQLYSLRFQYLHSQRFFVTTTAYYSGYHAEEQTLIRPTNSATLASDYRARLDDVGARVDVDYLYSPSHQVRAGLRVVGRRFRSSLDGALERSPAAVDSLGEASRLRSLELAGYVQDTWQPSLRWRVQPGLRASLFTSGGYARLGPRLNVQYAAMPGRLVLRGAAGVQMQYMHRLRDRYSFLYDLVSSRWIPASETVRPSSSLQATVGVKSSPWSWLTLGMDGYWQRSRHILLPEDVYQVKDGLEGPGIGTGALLGQYKPGRRRSYGVELSAQAQRGPWQVWLSYAGGRSTSRATTGDETAYRPARFDVPRSLQGVVSRDGERWSVMVSTELRSGFPYSVPVARYALGDPLSDAPTRYLYRPQVNNGRLPPYFRLDLTLGYRFGWVGADWQAQLQLYNVINHRNTIGREYDPQPTSVKTTDRRGLPLLPLVELEMEL